ncbi:hypothetical protein ACLOJK_027643 [Asimina triloba]
MTRDWCNWVWVNSWPDYEEEDDEKADDNDIFKEESSIDWDRDEKREREIRRDHRRSKLREERGQRERGRRERGLEKGETEIDRETGRRIERETISGREMSRDGVTSERIELARRQSSKMRDCRSMAMREGERSGERERGREGERPREGQMEMDSDPDRERAGVYRGQGDGERSQRDEKGKSKTRGGRRWEGLRVKNSCTEPQLLKDLL